MKAILPPALVLLGAAGFLVPQERGTPVTDDERTRFLFSAVYEGLIEDGAREENLKPILEKREEWFVTKCPICDAVYSGFKAYRLYIGDHGWKSDRRDGLPPWFGPGIPRQVAEGLAGADLKSRHAALQSLVEKYVSRRFEILRMSDERRGRMRESLKIGMKKGLERLKASGNENRFPESCPSCEGAN